MEPYLCSTDICHAWSHACSRSWSLTLISTLRIFRLNLIWRFSCSTTGVNIFIQFSFSGVYLENIRHPGYGQGKQRAFIVFRMARYRCRGRFQWQIAKCSIQIKIDTSSNLCFCQSTKTGTLYANQWPYWAKTNANQCGLDQCGSANQCSLDAYKVPVFVWSEHCSLPSKLKWKQRSFVSILLTLETLSTNAIMHYADITFWKKTECDRRDNWFSTFQDEAMFPQNDRYSHSQGPVITVMMPITQSRETFSRSLELYRSWKRG